jgi:tRNA-uridine 2-sulfurtransferase
MSPTNTSIYVKKKRVFVGLSGGVDSAVSATLLKEQGYDVTGVFIKAWQPEWDWTSWGRPVCSWRDERRDAMRVAIHLDIPFLFFDFEKEYKQSVVDKMIAEYKAGRTPNPDVLCNREIKFGSFLKKAREMGADFIATGHYARIAPRFDLGNPIKVEPLDFPILLEGKDKEKDQSYFLWTLTNDDLKHSLFPVGELKKSEVRKLAEKYKLPVAEKKDSQGICFLGDVSMVEFLSHYVTAKPGKVVNTEGEIIGKHDGLVYYTVGERRGFEVTEKSPDSGPFYIVAKDSETNSLVVSDEEGEILEFSPRKVVLKNVNWITEPENQELSGRIRYRGEKLPLILLTHGKKLIVEFKEPVRGLSLGQSLVFYDGEKCFGGGIMDKILE